MSPRPWSTRILATWHDDDCLRAELPTNPVDPRSPTELLEALASWLGSPVHAAIAAERRHGGCVERLFGGALLPDDTARVRFGLASDRPPVRLRGPGDFRDLYRVHGRSM
jgi:hypothetical protein